MTHLRDRLNEFYTHFSCDNLEAMSPSSDIDDVTRCSLLFTVLPENVCWILDFLVERFQVVQIGDYGSESIVLSTGMPQGRGLFPLLYNLFTYDCGVTNSLSVMVKFADDTTLSELTTNYDDFEYRNEVVELMQWGNANNLILTVEKMKEIIADFHTDQVDINTVIINGKMLKLSRVLDFSERMSVII